MQSQTKLSILVILTLGALLLLVNLGDAALWDRDEARNGLCAMEMLEKGDWIVPRLGDQLRVKKPPLVYWLMILSFQFFGVSEFAARFWSAVAGVLTLLLTFLIGSRFFSREVGLLGSLILLTTVLFVLCGRAATMDSVLLLFLTGAMFAFMRGDGRLDCRDSLDREGSRIRMKDALILYIFLGLAVLTKGPVAYLLPVAAILLYRISSHANSHPQGVPRSSSLVGILSKLFKLLMAELRNIRFLTGLGFVFLINGPWIMLVGLEADGKWLHGFFWVHNILRFTEPFEGHSGPIYYYLGALAAGFFPWSILAVPAALMTLRRIRDPIPLRNETLFLICWMIVHFTFYSLASTKLPHYILAIYPACAIGAAIFLTELRDDLDLEFLRLLSLGSISLIVVALMISAAVYVTAWILVPGAAVVGLFSGPLLISGLVTLLLWRKYYQAALVSFAMGGFLFLYLIFPVGAKLVDPFQNARSMLRSIEATDYSLASFGFFEPSWAFYAPRGCEELGSIGQAIDYLGSEDAVLVTTESGKKELGALFPGRIEEVTRQRRFLKSDWIYLIRGCSGHRRQ